VKLQELLKAIAKEDLHDLLTPYAITIAIEIAAKVWTEEYTKRYGTEIRDVIVNLAAQVPL
jgi:hypothetical protein